MADESIIVITTSGSIYRIIKSGSGFVTDGTLNKTRGAVVFIDIKNQKERPLESLKDVNVGDVMMIPKNSGKIHRTTPIKEVFLKVKGQ